MPSMTNKPIPTRAEIDEVAYNIQNWVDSFMLSDETAIWKYPLETVSTLHNIIIRYQNEINIKLLWKDINLLLSTVLATL
jgi:pyruvate kinase